MGKTVVKYEHHGQEVNVFEDLKGKHREHCLCYSCSKLTENDMNKGCAIANSVLATCKLTGIVSPVWECPSYTGGK